MQKQVIRPTDGMARKMPKQEPMETAQCQREYRQLLKEIQLFSEKLTDDNWDEWEDLWKRKAVLRARMNKHNL